MNSCTSTIMFDSWYSYFQIECMRLPPSAARGFREMILQDNGGPEFPPLPSLTILDLPQTVLSARGTLRLCDALMKRAEQGVPLEILDLRRCRATSYAVQLLGEIVVHVRALEAPYLMTSHRFFSDYDSEVEEGETHFIDDDEEEDEEGTTDEDEENEEEEDYSTMEED